MGSHRPPIPWLPAALLILIQVASGLRDSPQSAFFLLYLQDRFGLAPVTISTMVAGALAAGMLTALVGGGLVARLGSKRVLLAGLALSGISSLVFQVPTFWMAVPLWLLGGAGLALVTIGGQTTLTRIGAQGSLGIFAAIYAMSTTAGGAAGNLLAGVLIERQGYAAFSWAAMTVSTITFLLIAAWMERAQPQAAAPAAWKNLGSGLAAAARQGSVRLLVGLRALPTLYYGTLSVLIPLLLNSLTGSKVLVAAYGTTNLIVATAAQLIAGRAADRWGARVPTIIAYSALVLSGLGLFLWAGTVWGIFVFGVLGIAAAWSLSTLMYIWVNDGVPKAEHPATFGLLHAVWSISMISGSVLGGAFVETNPGLPFLIAGPLNLAAIFLIGVYYRHVLPVSSSTPATEA